MHKITLEGLDFFAYHGFLPAEQEIGNHYRVDISVETDISLACQTDALDDTIDYSLLYMLVAELMRTPTKLLEHIAHKILTTTFATFPTVQTVEVCVAKQNPPLGGLCHWAKVTLKLDRDATF
jgi:7,8-dihydroneopterin aldolase/epimerase/oxygenase